MLGFELSTSVLLIWQISGISGLEILDVLGKGLWDILVHLGPLAFPVSIVIAYIGYLLNKRLREITVAKEAYTQNHERVSLIRLLSFGERICNRMYLDWRKKHEHIENVHVIKLLTYMTTLRTSIISTRFIAPDERIPLLQIDHIIRALTREEVCVKDLRKFRDTLRKILKDMQQRSRS